MNPDRKGARVQPSTLALGLTVTFQRLDQAMACKASHQGIRRHNAQHSDRVPLTRKRHLVTWLEPDSDSEVLRDNNLPFAANAVSHTRQYNLERFRVPRPLLQGP
jgi:hypothetical protein